MAINHLILDARLTDSQVFGLSYDWETQDSVRRNRFRDSPNDRTRETGIRRVGQ